LEVSSDWKRIGGTLAACLWLATAGCTGSGGGPPGQAELTWGRRGISDGRLQKPRAITIDQQDQLYIVDMTGRIQVFTADGQFLRSWRTPAIENGKPCGLAIDRQGHLLVADTHYFRVLFYTPTGQLLEDKTIGGQPGHQPGQFNFVTDVVQDSHGNYYISEYGEYDRIQKFTAEGEFVMQWGSHGVQPGQFARPQGLEIDEHDHIWVADACNHRLQVFDASGTEARLIKMWGQQGTEPGQLSYPYGLVLDGKGHVYVSEFGNHRVQKLTLDGESRGCWGRPGRQAGELSRPWGLVLDSQGRIHALDTYNHRVQRLRW
jgi:sugar lactone lactonase YvrE